jgi:L-lactate dehydrogenase (cytochrome)
MITKEELARHRLPEDCWVAIEGKVYDLTGFLDRHPGGRNLLLPFAGKDATRAFTGKHPSSFLTMIPAKDLKGELEGWIPPAGTPAAEPGTKPPLESLLNVREFQAVAEASMGRSEWLYYSSAAQDERTFAENEAAFGRWWFRPRVLVDVSRVDTSTTVLGYQTSFPLFLSASALAGLADPEAEVALARAAQAAGVLQMVPTISTKTHEEIAAARAPGQTQFFQLYVSRDHRVTESLVRRVEELGYRAIFLTVDTPLVGRRERDKGVIRSLGTISDPSLTWDFVDWLKTITTLPLVLKGIQRGEDAVLAEAHGAAGVVVSNHGGRQLDGARPTLDALIEVRRYLRHDSPLEVYLDGGVRRGGDIVKALALGARAVGLARPVLYGLASYGQAGAEAVFNLLHEETALCMALCGAPAVGAISRDLVARSFSDS